MFVFVLSNWEPKSGGDLSLVEKSFKLKSVVPLLLFGFLGRKQCTTNADL